MNITLTNSIITALGVTVFLAIVITLHVIQIQIGYSPTDQLMSELALGKYGFAMFFAFISLAVACLGSERILHSARSSIVISMLLWGASLSFFGAGYFKLGSHTEIHIGLVSLAFILLGLTMYLTPRLISGFNSLSSYCICWGL